MLLQRAIRLLSLNRTEIVIFNQSRSLIAFEKRSKSCLTEALNVAWVSIWWDLLFSWHYPSIALRITISLHQTGRFCLVEYIFTYIIKRFSFISHQTMFRIYVTSRRKIYCSVSLCLVLFIFNTAICLFTAQIWMLCFCFLASVNLAYVPLHWGVISHRYPTNGTFSSQLLVNVFVMFPQIPFVFRSEFTQFAFVFNITMYCGCVFWHLLLHVAFIITFVAF